MAEFPAMPFWTDAYLGDTRHLTTIEHGAYLLLLICMWRSDAYLPNDDKLLAKFAGLTSGQWRRIKPVLMPFFDVEGDRITQGRLNDEYKAVRQYSKRQSVRAKARWLKTKETGDATASERHMPPLTPYPLPTVKEKRDTKVSPKKTGTRIPEDWVLPKDWGEWAVSEGYPEAGIRLEAAKFHDYWKAKSGKDATKLDWSATWRNWMRNSKTPKAINGGYENGKPASKSAQRIRAWTEGARGTFGAP